MENNNKVRIKRQEEDIYRINIADDGTEIVFDLADIGLAIKANKAFNDVEANRQRAITKIQVIDKKYANQAMNEKLQNQKDNETLEVYREMFVNNRRIMDRFLGLDGAMQKLFGDSNYLDMYDDLYEALEPHFKKMEINIEKVKARIEQRYKNKENVIK